VGAPPSGRFLVVCQGDYKNLPFFILKNQKMNRNF
jgi:hypothetical protein